MTLKVFSVKVVLSQYHQESNSGKMCSPFTVLLYPVLCLFALFYFL